MFSNYRHWYPVKNTIKRNFLLVGAALLGSSSFVVAPALMQSNNAVAQAQAISCNPSTQNPLRGFKDPLNGAGRVTRSTHPDVIQRYADDLGASIGTPIYNMRKGRVLQVVDSFPDRRGPELDVNHLVIEVLDAPTCVYSRDGRSSQKMKFDMLYLHIQKGSAKVRKGDIVEAGQNIANVGHNGNSTGPHLHVEVNAMTGGKWYQRLTVPYVWDSNRNR